MVAAWNELPPSGELPECAALVELAERLRGSAPELVVQYARRVLTDSGASTDSVVVRAQGLLGAALVRLGRHAEAVDPAMVALRGDDVAGVPEFVSTVRLDLAACSVGLGEPLIGCGILRPVLDAAGARPATRAGAIAQLVGCTAHVGRRDDLEDSLAEADRLLAADEGLGADTRRMERALLAVRTAAYHRRYGESEDAVEAARAGLGLLARLRDARLEGGRARVGLVLELVCALLDDGQLAEAEHEAGPTLAQPVRAASAPAMGRLLLAIATRVLLPAGRVEAGRGLLDHATWIAERHELDWLLADGLTAKADLDERAGRPADALRALRAAHAAEHRHRRSIELARRRLMVEFGAREPALDVVNSLLRNVIRTSAAGLRANQETIGTRTGVPAPGPAPAPRPPTRMPSTVPAATTDRTTGSDEPSSDAAETDAATGLLTREGLSRRLEAARRGNRPVALTLVRLDTGNGAANPTNGSGPSTGTEQFGVRSAALAALAGRVRDIAPVDAELARPAGSELAVLLPHTTRDQAEEFAATIRESAIGPEVSISTGVAQSGPGPATGEDAEYLLSAAREMLTAAASTSQARLAPRPPDPRSEASFRAGPAVSAAAVPKPLSPNHREPRDPLPPRNPVASHAEPTRRDSAPDESFGRDLTAAGRTGVTDSASDPARRELSSEESFRRELPASAGTGAADTSVVPERRASNSPRSVPGGLFRTSPAPLPPGGSPEPTESGGEVLNEPPGGPTTSARTDARDSGAAAPDRREWGSEGSFLRGLAASAGTNSGVDSDRRGSSQWEPRSGESLLRGLAALTAAEIGSPAPENRTADAGSGGHDLSFGSGRAIRDLLAPLLDHPTLSHRGSQATVPGVPGPDEVPEPPGTTPTEPAEVPRMPEPPDVIIPAEPDQVPPPPGPEPAPEVPPPAEARENEPPTVVLGDAVLGPIQGPEPRPPDLPPRSDRATLRRDRADATSIADLLTEALVAYQATTPEEPAPPDPAPENLPPAHRTGSGRHRMPDWASSDPDGT